MSGHSKWSTIKHKKAKEDAKRGKAFTKLIKEITVAARLSGGAPETNPRLRLLLDKAKEINMPQDNVTRAIKKGTGELPGVSYEEMEYEGYGPHGVAVILELLTDNKNRSVSELRRVFSSKGGNLAETGSVSWMFERLGVIRAASEIDEDALLEALLDFDIKDIKCEDKLCTVYCDLKSIELAKKKMQELGLTIESAEPEWVAKNNMSVPEEDESKIFDFLSVLQDHDDVKNVYTNLQ